MEATVYGVPVGELVWMRRHAPPVRYHSRRFIVLEALEKNGDMGTDDLAHLLGHDGKAAYRALLRLKHRGLIDSYTVPNPENPNYPDIVTWTLPRRHPTGERT